MFPVCALWTLWPMLTPSWLGKPYYYMVSTPLCVWLGYVAANIITSKWRNAEVRYLLLSYS